MAITPVSRRSRQLLRLALLCAMAAATPLAAMQQMQNRTVVSPISNQRFDIIAVPAASLAVETMGLADMGADDDGCRHSSGISDYEYYVATCPYSYFSALTVEWDEKTGRFMGDLAPAVREWVLKDFNSEWQIDHNRAFQNAQAIARAEGKPPLDRDKFAMSQGAIPPDKRYRYALLCYEKRGARPAVLAKVALTGAWALRARLNIPVNHPALAGGFEEVNDKLLRKITDGEGFSLDKWTSVYKDIFTGSRLSNEAYLVAGMVYFGFVVRQGDLKGANQILDKMTERFKPNKENNDGMELMRSLVRERRETLKKYLGLLDVSIANFTRAIQDEEFTRQRLPEVLLVVAESLRRAGRDSQAMDWYLALAQMVETQPKLRADIRTEKRAPGPDAPYPLQVGWIADKHIAELTAAGLVHPGVPAGVDKNLLNAILFEGLGSLEYKNPTWKPASGGNQRDCAIVIDLVGKATLDFNYRYGSWPKSLGELWEKDAMRDRNRVNRFHCPVTGEPFLYKELAGTLDAKTIVVATAKPVPTNQGPRYGAYLANNAVVWSETPLAPGDVHLR